MTMTETLKIIEESLYCSNPLPYEAMLNCYAAVKIYIEDHEEKGKRHEEI